MKFIYLSHILTEKIPVYGGEGLLSITSVKALEKGDLANIFSFSIENHWGTHIDAPNHFFEKGQKVSDYPANLFFFESPRVIQVSLEPSDILKCDNWVEEISHDNDLLLLQAGWSRFRGQQIYSSENPGIHPEVGAYLRTNYPNIKAIGIDWISVSSFQDRELGRQAHRAFLDPKGVNKPILLIEDMDLSQDLRGLKQVWAAPLRIEGIDSAPCTVMGRVEDN